MATKRFVAQDDPILYALRRDLSGGINTRQHEQVIGENQAVTLENILLETAGARSIRTGQSRVDSSYPASSSTGNGLFGFDPVNGTFELLAIQSTNLSGWTGSGSFSNYKTDLTGGVITTIVKAGMQGQGDIALVSNGVDNVYAMYQDHTMHDLGNTTDSPPLTTAMAYYGNRVWAIKNNLAYFSDAYPADYATAFDRVTNAFQIPIGNEKAVIGTRDQGIIFLGGDQIWRLIPSTVPDPSTDQPQKILEIGCVTGATAVQVADDIIFLAPDGVRGLFRTQLDKLQTGQSFPLSYVLQDEFNSINWAHIDKACAVYFDNKYIISLPTGYSTYNNTCWVYYPAYNGWVVYSGWNIASFAKLRVSGQERLYGQDSVNGQVYRLFYGSTDNGTAITYEEISRAEDFGQPMVYKYGGEYKVKARGGNGVLVVSANPDGSGWIQLGTIDLNVSGVTFPITYPVVFANTSEINGTFHLDDAGVTKFKRVKFEIYCDSSGADITVLETIATAFAEQYLSEN